MSRRASRRSTIPDPPSLPEPTRRSRSSRVKAEVEEVNEAVDEDENENEAGPSKTRARPSLRARTRTQEEVVEDEEDEESEKPYRVRNRKSVSYREVPVDTEEYDEELSSAGEEEKSTPPPRSSHVPDTPSRRRKASASASAAAATADSDTEKGDKPFVAEKEKVGSGRGGFSVKGAAAAAARARWAKVRLEKAERGEDDDNGKERKKGRIVRRENRAAVEKLKDGEVVTIRGVDYVVANDELPIPDDPKGETKIDHLGRLKGGREYKIFTFSSEGRDDTERLYALTIDVARTCGYSDSLAFLRRYPVIQKLQCQPGEAEMLVEVGRVAGNMKHRMVTIVPIHNVYKLMGARIIKDGKWVTDDYYEDESLAKCAENGYTPYTLVQEEEIIAGTNGAAGVRGDREREALTSAISKTNALSPFYTIGGPSTHFGGAGIDPWTEGGHGNRRAKLKGSGVTAEDWMYRTASECRMIDEMLKQYREERVGVLEGKDLNGWVWMAEERTDRTQGVIETGTGTGKMEITGSGDSLKPESALTQSGLRPPTMDRQRSGLSREVTFEPEAEAESQDIEDAAGDISMGEIKEGDEVVPQSEPLTELADDEPTSAVQPLLEVMESSVPRPELRVETEAESAERRKRYAWGAGDWSYGTIKAAYEPHTHMPHVPLYTQSTVSQMARLSPYPILSSTSTSDSTSSSTVRGKAVKGLASIEYVFEPQYDYGVGQEVEYEMRQQVIKEAEEWERQNRQKASIAN